MLKPDMSVKHIEAHAGSLLEELLRRIPSLALESVEVAPTGADQGIDVLARIRLAKRDYALVCEVKQSGQPRFAREAINQLKARLPRFNAEAVPVFIAPFLSAATRELCWAENVGYLDFEGNAHIAFGPVYIEKETASRPEAEKREFRSLFKPRSAQVLRVLLRDPERGWKLSQLAEESGVSIGHVSNVRDALIDREWAVFGNAGIELTAPDDLLNAWRESYRTSAAEELKFYTHLHRKSWEKALRQFFEMNRSLQVELASFSSAQWIAPYARTSTHFFYADTEALSALKGALDLSKPAMGENVVIWVPTDAGVFTDAFEADGAIRCASPLQTYLDLAQVGDRGLEAADHLRKAKLVWTK